MTASTRFRAKKAARFQSSDICHVSWNMRIKLIFVVYFGQDYRHIVIERHTRKSLVTQRCVNHSDEEKNVLEFLKIKIKKIKINIT